MITCCQKLSQGQIGYPDTEECGPSTSYDLSGSAQRYEQLPMSNEHRPVSVKHFAQCTVEQGAPPKTDDCRLLSCSTKRAFLTIGTKVILSRLHEAEDHPFSLLRIRRPYRQPWKFGRHTPPQHV